MPGFYEVDNLYLINFADVFPYYSYKKYVPVVENLQRYVC